jgi:hypothetical protein
MKANGRPAIPYFENLWRDTLGGANQYTGVRNVIECVLSEMIERFWSQTYASTSSGSASN